MDEITSLKRTWRTSKIVKYLRSINEVNLLNVRIIVYEQVVQESFYD